LARSDRKIEEQRWDDPLAFSAAWSERNRFMVDLFVRKVDDAADASFSEYGCGPHATFAAEVK